MQQIVVWLENLVSGNTVKLSQRTTSTSKSSATRITVWRRMSQLGSKVVI